MPWVVVELRHFRIITPIKSMRWRHSHLERERADGQWRSKTRFFNLVVGGITLTRNANPNLRCLRIIIIGNETTDNFVHVPNGIGQEMDYVADPRV
jgi:hypothetical protein